MIRDLIDTGSKRVANDLIIMPTRNTIKLIENGMVQIEFDLEDESPLHVMEQITYILVDYLEKNYESR
tara:strand:+ start:580 stop:783 length:204 start_codon:yes stop_codon:yes gene_type:complete